jgi:hypothetical protein
MTSAAGGSVATPFRDGVFSEKTRRKREPGAAAAISSPLPADGMQRDRAARLAVGGARPDRVRFEAFLLAGVGSPTEVLSSGNATR